MDGGSAGICVEGPGADGEGTLGIDDDGDNEKWILDGGTYGGRSEEQVPSDEPARR